MNDQSDHWTALERVCIDNMLDVLLPVSGELPAGGRPSTRRFLAQRVEDTEGLGQAIATLLNKASELMKAHQTTRLDSLGNTEQIALVKELQTSEPQAFLRFMTQAFLGYYTEPSIPPKFGMPDRPPQPLGHKIPEDEDLETLLAPVRERGRHYKEC